MGCPCSCLTTFIVSCVCSHTVYLAVHSLVVRTLTFQTCPFLLSLGYKNVCIITTWFELWVVIISMKVEAKGQTAFEIDLCQANEFSFSAVKSEVLWSEIKINSAQSTHLVPWTLYYSPLLWSVMKGFQKQWVRLHVVSNEHRVISGNVQSTLCSFKLKFKCTT